VFQSLERFLGSLDTSRALPIPEAEAMAHGNLGRLAQLQGRYGAALESYDRAIAIVDELGDPRGLAEFTLFATGALVELGRYEAAAERLEEAAGWVGEAPSHEHEAELARLRGEVALGLGEVERAEGHFRAALESARASGGFLAEMSARRGLARAALFRTSRQGRDGEEAAAPLAAKAAEDLSEVVAEARGSGFATVYLETSIDLAEARLRAGDLAGAQGAARDALRATAGLDGYAGAWRLHAVQARSHEAAGDPAAAARAWSMAQSEIERVRGGLRGAEQQAFLDLPEVRRVAERAAEG
jgi:tetratricopeptide (TPR) repeat protein